MAVYVFDRKPTPAWNEEVARDHAGEDGPCWRVDTVREMFIDWQAFAELGKHADERSLPFLYELCGEFCG